MKTTGSLIISLNRISKPSEHDRVMIQVTVLKINEPEQLARGRLKDVKFGDASAQTNNHSVEEDEGNLLKNKSYQLNLLEVHSYLYRQDVPIISIYCISC